MDTSPRDTETGSIRHAQETDNPKTVDSRDVEHLETDGLDDEEYTVTIKTWTVVTVMSWSYGISFWNVATLAAIQGTVATILGNPANANWWTTVYTMCNAIAFMLFGSNSDLFGRRWFIVSGNLLVCAGMITLGVAKNTETVIVANALTGFVGPPYIMHSCFRGQREPSIVADHLREWQGGGLCQLSMFAVPELLPNRMRHIGILITDAVAWITVLVGPVAARYAVAQGGDEWRWLYYAGAIAAAVAFGLLVWLYHPPKHPRGVPWHQAARELDYVGALLFVIGAVLVFTGVIYTGVVSSSDPRVIGMLVSGFGVIVIFALWETFMPLKQPLTPPRIFAKDKGREFTAPFIAGTIVNMTFYSVNIVYPTQINVFYTNASTPLSYSLKLTLPQNLGLIFGAMLLWIFGSHLGRRIGWTTQFTAAYVVMVLFGALMALGTPQNRGLMMAFVFLCEAGYGFAQYLSITFIQAGVGQTELGIAGALAGVARWTGGSLSASIYTSILSSVQSKHAKTLVPAAAIAAGLAPNDVPQLVEALGKGATALEKVPGITTKIIQAAGAAVQQSYVQGLKVVCLTSIGFGVVGIVATLFCNDLEPKMNNKIEVFLENDINAEKNKYH